MKLESEQRGKYLLIRARGRLDAAWADHFTDTMLRHIREGRHHLVIDGSEMVFLSSAGIRSLVMIYRELNSVRGSFSIVNPTDFVAQTLRTSGFQQWLGNGLPDDMPDAGAGEAGGGKNAGIDDFILNEGAGLTLSEPADWRPWQTVEARRVRTFDFPPETVALGIGSAAGTFEDARDRFGEFLAVAGNVVFQPPGEQAPPDYLVAEAAFVPRLQCIQAFHLTGEMAHLLRFAPTDDTPFYPVSELLNQILDRTGGRAAGFVVFGEIEGLVGTALVRSPGRIREEGEIHFPEIRDWLTFCGERAHAHQQAILAGVVSKTGGRLLPPLPSRIDMAAHIHAAVFPYQPLENGNIGLRESIRKFFNGPPPLAVLHLAEDRRPVVGLGESALIRGACWFSPLQNPEVAA